MTKSETIGNLAKALSQAQAEIKGAVKDSNNPFFKMSYADLASVWDACREPLTKHGLSVIQTLDVVEHGVIVETTLAHESGEWIMGRLLLNPTKNDPQGIGSAITYGRRYSLAAIVGVCPEDDDGEAAMGRKVEKKSAQVADKQGAAASSPPSPAPPTDKPNYKFLEVMKGQKERVGEDYYYKTLGLLGYEKANEIHDRNHQKELYEMLLAIPDKEIK